jgi:ribosomal protein L40E
VNEDARCARCGGLLAPDAEWCGQCFAPVERAPAALPEPPAAEAVAAAEARDPIPPPVEPMAVATPGGGGLEIARGTGSWDCAVCGERNPIEASRCSVCQTPFARLFERPEERTRIEPKTAALWSLAFAGLGHWRAGLRAEGVARMIVFAWTLGTVLVFLVSGSGGGFGSAASLFALYALSAAGIYALSAIDAYRSAAGMPALVPSRVLLWASAALVLLSLVLATFVTLPAARG